MGRNSLQNELFHSRLLPPTTSRIDKNESPRGTAEGRGLDPAALPSSQTILHPHERYTPGRISCALDGRFVPRCVSLLLLLQTFVLILFSGLSHRIRGSVFSRAAPTGAAAALLLNCLCMRSAHVAFSMVPVHGDLRRARTWFAAWSRRDEEAGVHIYTRIHATNRRGIELRVPRG